MTTLTTYQLKRKIESIKEANRGSKPIIIVEMWQPDRGDGVPGFCRFDTRTPYIRTPIYTKR